MDELYMTDELCMSIAEAIVAQAAKDYRDARKKLRKDSEDYDAQWLLHDAKRFFLSEWFYELSECNGEYVLRKLEEEFE